MRQAMGPRGRGRVALAGRSSWPQSTWRRGRRSWVRGRGATGEPTERDLRGKKILGPHRRPWPESWLRPAPWTGRSRGGKAYGVGNTCVDFLQTHGLLSDDEHKRHMREGRRRWTRGGGRRGVGKDVRQRIRLEEAHRRNPTKLGVGHGEGGGANSDRRAGSLGLSGGHRGRETHASCGLAPAQVELHASGRQTVCVRMDAALCQKAR